MGDNISINIGGGFTGLLTIVFITLKLLGKIDWSWLWVLSPLWIPIAIVIVFLLIALVVVLIVLIIMGIIKLFTR